MKKNFTFGWLLILAGVVALCVWISHGAIFVRKQFFGVAPILAESRTESQFIALLLPPVALERRKYAMATPDLTEFLGALTASGYTSIGIEDVAELYASRRGLPPKAVLITYAQDDPQGIEAADGVMKRLRLRGLAFIRSLAVSGADDQRRYLTRHAVNQMSRGGTWDIGFNSRDSSESFAALGEFRALLDGGNRPRRVGTGPQPLRFSSSEMSLNDAKDNPYALKVLAIRPERSVSENIGIVHNSWIRSAEFSENFSTTGLRSDWIAGWGVVSMGNHRLAILPTPRQSSAGVFLRGTEKWSDHTLEFELKRYQKEFWAYARYSGDDRFVRVGARNGYWYVEQKIGPKYLPSMLARSPIQEGDLPARVRLVLKGAKAIVHVNGRMQFGKVLSVHPSIDMGRVLLGVYDAKSRSALAVLTSVRAAPLGEAWLSFKRDASDGFDERRLETLREEAVHARALSPRWVAVDSGGGVSVAETQGMLIRSLAGFYGCRLVPMADFPQQGLSALGNPLSVERLVRDLSDAAHDLDVAGLNLRLRGDQAWNLETTTFLKKLHAAFSARHRELWVTVDSNRPSEAAMGLPVDGVLELSDKAMPDFEVLEALRSPSMAQLAPQPIGLALTQTAGEPQRELH